MIIILLSSCSTINKSSFSGKVYETKSFHMVGSSSIDFSDDSTFTYTERNGSLYTKGTWQIDGRFIVLSSYNPQKLGLGRFTGDCAMYFSISGENKMKIKSTRKLEYKERIFQEKTVSTKPPKF